MTVPPEDRYGNVRRLGELGGEIERRRGPEPYPRPTSPAPHRDERRARHGEIKPVALRYGATTLRVFGSAARGDAGSGSDLDVLVDMDTRRTLFDQGDPEDLLGCPVHVTTTGGWWQARAETRERIEQEAVRL